MANLWQAIAVAAALEVARRAMPDSGYWISMDRLRLTLGLPADVLWPTTMEAAWRSVGNGERARGFWARRGDSYA